MVHLVECDDKEKILKKILDGSKTMLVRGSTIIEVPHGQVFTGETLYFMERKSEKISARALVTEVDNYLSLEEKNIMRLLNDNQDKLCLSLKQKKKWHKKNLCIIEFDSVEIIEPLEFDKKCLIDSWLILENIEDVIVGSSRSKYYDKSRR